MPRHIDVWLDNVSLAAVGPVLIQQVYEDPPSMEILNGERPSRSGLSVLSKKRQSLRVAIEVQIRELRDLSYRARVFEQIASWCKGSMLELSNRPDRRLRVTCTAFPALGAVRDYASMIRLEFTAFEVPYWEDKVVTSKTFSGAASEDGDTVTLPGTAPAPLSLAVTPAEETLTSFSVTFGSRSVTLSGLSVPAESTLLFSRDALDNLMISAGDVSQLQKRTAASDDDLTAEPGLVPFSFEANTACEVVTSVRGRWL